MKIFKVLSELSDYFEKAKSLKNPQDLVPIIFVLENIQSILDDFVNVKIKPICDKIEAGMSPEDIIAEILEEPKQENSSDKLSNIDFILENFTKGEDN